MNAEQRIIAGQKKRLENENRKRQEREALTGDFIAPAPSEIRPCGFLRDMRVILPNGHKVMV